MQYLLLHSLLSLPNEYRQLLRLLAQRLRTPWLLPLPLQGLHRRQNQIHKMVMATSPNYFNLNRPVRMNGTLDVR